MHPSVMSFVADNAGSIYAPVLEVGSFNVNGSVRSLCPTPYTGIDIVPGRGVDMVVAEGAGIPFDDGVFQTVISTNMLEHSLDPVENLREMVRVLAPGGVLVVTAPSNGYEFHCPPDRWRIMPGTLSEIAEVLGLSSSESADPQCPGCFLIAIKPFGGSE